MTKKLIYILFICFVVTVPAFAEKIPVRITPLQVISTHHDETEIGDCIKFTTVNDVFVKDKIYIKKYTDIVGVVDHVHDNGWGGDAAEIVFKNFYTTDINNNKINFTYPLDINGNSEMASSTREVGTYSAVVAGNSLNLIDSLRSLNYFRYINFVGKNYSGFILRGSEIFIEPDTKVYNIFIEK